MRSLHNLVLVAILLAIFSVNSDAVNMCKDPAHLGNKMDSHTSEDHDTCYQINEEIARKLPGASSDTVAFPDTITCTELCGPESADAIQEMRAHASCCGATVDKLLCHSYDGTCDAEATVLDDSLTVQAVFNIFLIILVLLHLLSLFLCCTSCCCVPEDQHSGLVYLPPAPSAELHISIGGVLSKKGQDYAEWMPLFQEAISEKDYNLLIGRIKEYQQKNSINICHSAFAFSFICYPWGMAASYCLVKEVQRITRDLDNIAKDYNGARVEFFHIKDLWGGCPGMFVNTVVDWCGNPTPRGFDQYGRPCRVWNHGGQGGPGHWQVVWPPSGFNIILKAPTHFDLRAVWPGAACSASNVQPPQINQMGIPPPPYTPPPPTGGSINV